MEKREYEGRIEVEGKEGNMGRMRNGERMERERWEAKREMGKEGEG